MKLAATQMRMQKTNKTVGSMAQDYAVHPDEMLSIEI
jgi:hypothetical protein